MKTINNTQDVIDSRDVIERIAELESTRDDMIENVPDNERGNMENTEWKEWEESEEYAELTSLLSLQDELEGYCDDWEYGVVIIRSAYFTDYTKELLEDCGYIPKDFPEWIEIDWEKTAENVQVDYTSADFDGVEYWAR